MADLKIPDDLKYAKSDEWVRVDGETATIGVSDYAQDQLNDIVFLEFPEIGARFEKGANFGVIESVKAASDLFMPVAGTITEINTALEDEPEIVNVDPYERGWIIKVKLDGDADTADLMDASAYIEYNASR